MFFENDNSFKLESFTAHRTAILPFIGTSVNPEDSCHFRFQSVRGIWTAQMFNQFLELCPNIYSLKIYSKMLMEMTHQVSNEKICSLLQRMIKRIQFNDSIEERTRIHFYGVYVDSHLR